MSTNMLTEALRSLVSPCKTDQKTRDHRPARRDRGTGAGSGPNAADFRNGHHWS